MNENSIVSNLINIYERFGFKKIKLSKFEDYNLYNNNKDFLQTEHILTFMNLNGNLKSLRPDVTLSIVKKVLKDNEKETQKIYYIEDIYKIVSNEYEEIPQVGVEIIGKLNNYSNLEIISMAIESLKSINKNYILEISNIDFISAIFDEINLEENLKIEILNNIYLKNKHDLEKLLNKNVDCKYKKYILSFIELSGNYKDILKKLKSLIINKKMQKSYEELKSLSFVFELYNNFDKILLDFSIESQLGYYNGIIFKGYIKESNDIILSGGRYDKLLNKFNSNKNAIGFAIYMDKLYEKNKTSDFIDILILYKSGDENILLNEVRKFMNKNKKVRVDIYGDNSIENYKDKYIFDKDKLIKY
ncbi:ATP phosphoribosyltransferase regulatory subunit [Brachyspira aalborgi]|uniref:ATP phosphoribosyltransferase regulatory subunit n=1 Tax=Brachyspira aalborgi TaxID=29522 RepID=A0A5C8E870_9SPIR|nr:ATP phosphoribosyltransferase regulatory subunit [Brachyspira aalborgi]TXJ33224.1 ATP phosphoribosyltransferase regulatory subunit [Brachyspira aalborgi]TXJ55703.1 ATP phosphoribosyltransferase regulatory subunit [Brachyspira aalborgi]